MGRYEAMFILRPGLEDETEVELLDNFKALITKLGGEPGEFEDWGMRKLAYEIDKFNEGHYCLLKFTGSGEVLPELEHFFRVADEVIRYMVVREGE
jgi:small subunit ribosomal protein S6